jgi:hypothetical protein
VHCEPCHQNIPVHLSHPQDFAPGTQQARVGPLATRWGRLLLTPKSQLPPISTASRGQQEWQCHPQLRCHSNPSAAEVESGDVRHIKREQKNVPTDCTSMGAGRALAGWEWQARLLRSMEETRRCAAPPGLNRGHDARQNYLFAALPSTLRSSNFVNSARACRLWTEKYRARDAVSGYRHKCLLKRLHGAVRFDEDAMHTE